MPIKSIYDEIIKEFDNKIARLLPKKTKIARVRIVIDLGPAAGQDSKMEVGLEE